MMPPDRSEDIEADLGVGLDVTRVYRKAEIQENQVELLLLQGSVGCFLMGRSGDVVLGKLRLDQVAQTRIILNEQDALAFRGRFHLRSPLAPAGQ